MKLLSIECSATPCSAAISEDGKILASDFTNEKMTHSQTLIPMVLSVLNNADVNIKEIDGFAVSAGPGSFTGVRIGISAVKGMAAARKNPCYPVSALRCMAENCVTENCIVCAVMDARCSQVYNALFKAEDGKITRLCEDRALLSEELRPEIEELAKENKIVVVGDGTEVFYPFVAHIENVIKSDEGYRYQNAIGVAKAAEELINNNTFVSPEELQPVYLRLPQAERELKKKEELKK